MLGFVNLRLFTNWKICLGVSAAIGTSVAVITIFKRTQRKRMMSTKNLLTDLEKGNVYIKDRERVLNIIQSIAEAGRDRLQVIADWDNTLTCFTYKGERCDTCYNCLDRSSRLPAWYTEKAIAIRDFYYAIEIDPTLTVDEKYPYMIEWWTKAHDLLVECNLNKSLIEQIVRESNVRLREGCEWLFQSMNKHNVPLLIFSAGVGDVIEEVVRQNEQMYENITIVSNYMDFNHQGKLTGFKGDLIHVFNKNENAVHNSDYFENLKKRDNILLLGDSVGDLKMAEGADKCSNILTIGFLNDKIEERLDTYKDLFDIVIVGDESIQVPNAIVQEIFKS